MCATSAILDYGMHHKPWENFPVYPYPFPAPIPPLQLLPDLEACEAIKKFMDLLEAAKNFDRATKQADCEDPQKAAFEDEMRNRLSEIEKRLSVVT